LCTCTCGGPHRYGPISAAVDNLHKLHNLQAARQLQWTHVPLMSAQEIGVPDSVPMCIRVLILWNTPRSQEEVVHVYLRRAASLRPDLSRR